MVGEFAYKPQGPEDSGTLHPGHIKDEGVIWDVSTPAGLAAYMKQTKDHHDWARRCDLLKKQLGDYPSYWYPTMIMSGLMDEILGPGSSEIKIYSFGPPRN